MTRIFLAKTKRKKQFFDVNVVLLLSNFKKMMRVIFSILFVFISLNSVNSQSGKSILQQKKMILIPKGVYNTFFISKSKKPIQVASFLMDETAVTNAEFLEFVKANPSWRKSKINRLFADKNYLSHWDSDLEIGESKKNIYNSPVVNVSWFAAQAYCNWKQKRLPTLAQWELAGSAAPKNVKYTSVASYILHWYEKPALPVLPNIKTTYINSYGLFDMHGLIWEWAFDFNSFIGSTDSRNTTNDDQNLFCAGASINVTNRDDYAAFLRYSFRGSLKGNYCISSLGFRCAKNIK